MSAAELHDLERLRRRAAALVADPDPERARQWAADAARLLHELDVARTEVELQQEELAGAYEREGRSNQRLRNLFDLAPVPYLVCDAAGVVREANLAAAELLGVERRTLRDKPFVVYLAPASHEAFLRHRTALLESGRALPLEAGLRCRDGSSVTVRMESGRTVDPGGEVLCLTALLDVTRAVHAESALHATRHFLESMIAASPLAIVALDAGARVSYWSPAAERLFGWRQEEVVGQPNPLPPASVPAAAEQSLQRRIFAGEAFRGLRVRCRRQDGGTVDVSLSASALHGADGDVVGAVGLFEDVTAKQRQEDALKWEHAVHGALAALAHEILRDDRDEQGIAAAVLARACALTGSDRGWVALEAGGTTAGEAPRVVATTGAAAGDSLSCKPGCAVVDGSPGLCGEALRRGEPVCRNGTVRCELHGDGATGGAVFRGFLAVPVRVRDAVLGQIAVVDGAAPYGDRHVEVVEQLADLYALALDRARSRRSRENLQSQLRRVQRQEAIGTFAGGIAHDFNNILTPVLAHAELALMSLEDDHPAYADVESVLAGSERATDLVRQILTLARGEEEEAHPLDPTPVVKEVLKFLRAAIPATIEIRSRLEGHGQQVVMSPSHLHQVVMNLCTNAWQAMRAEGGVLEVCLDDVQIGQPNPEAGLELDAGAYLRLQVSDTGPGVDPAIAERIFDPYVTTKQPGEGTGLGLSVVRGIVEHCSGEVRCHAAPGGGARFEVLLPVAPGQEPAAEPRERRVPPGTEHILLVDDESTILGVMEKMLVRLGYTVRTFQSSREALAAFCEQPHAFDLLLSDQTMPELTGDRLAEAVHQLRPELPVLLFTGYSERLDAARVSAVGAREVLFKPVGMEALAQALRRALDA